MSGRELTRVEVLSRVKAGTLSLGSAATLLAVSYRQAKRLARRYRAEGAKGLRHRSAGGASNHARPPAERARVLALVREKYSGSIDERFGPTLAAEHLASEDGITVHHDTLRRWMLAAGLWSRARKRSPHRARRERKAHFGELVQLDGSFHRWYEARAPRGCLMNLVDDATGRTLARLGAQETIWAAVDVLRRWIEAYGVPLALYTDWKNVYVREPNAEEQATGAVPLTQFGRMCAALGIQIIAASSPQAKGRVERNHGTHQDRLVKKLRRLGIAERCGGECVPGDDVSARAQRPLRAGPGVGRGLSSADAESTHARSGVPARGDARAVQRLGHPLRHAVLASGAAESLAPARSTVVVCEAVTGAIETSLSRPPDALDRDPGAAAGRPPDGRARPPAGAPAQARPRGRRRSSLASRTTRTARPRRPPIWVAAAVKSLWTLPEPWTRRARAHRSLENHRTVFHSAHRASHRGHFYFVKNGDISISL